MIFDPAAPQCRIIFGYGSLMWRPDFAFAQSHMARIAGFHRRLCVVSKHYRGTAENPGLVFGLDRGGSSFGVAYAVTDADWPEVLDYVRKREMITGVYREVVKPVMLVEQGQTVRAVTYVVDRQHEQYAAPMSLEETAAIIRRATGLAGSCRDYVLNTAQHLRKLGITDKALEALVPHLKESGSIDP